MPAGDYEDGKNQNRLRGEDIGRIDATYRAFETVDKYAYRATLDEIRENEFNCNIPRYVDTFKEEEEIDLEGVRREIAELELELSRVRSGIDEFLDTLGIDE